MNTPAARQGRFYHGLKACLGDNAMLNLALVLDPAGRGRGLAKRGCRRIEQ